MVSYRYGLVQRLLSAVLLMSFLGGCALPLIQPASYTRNHAFITYWPPSKDNDHLRLAVKDLIDVKGAVTTAGSEYVAKNSQPAARDAKCLSIARQRNVQIVGKANLSEFAISPSGINDYFGTPKSPFGSWFRRYIPGGSSSGSAAAITSGMADVALGTDSSGSIRTPAACSGIVGLKTTFGLIPLDGIFPVDPKHLDTVGPMAKDVAHVVEGMDLLEDGFAARYRAAVAAKPSGKQIKVGRLYVNQPDPGDLALAVADPGSLVLGVTDLKNLFFSLTDPRMLSLGGTDPRIDKAVDEALVRSQFKVVVLGQDFTAKWRQAQKDSNVVAAAGAWMSDQKYQDKLGVSVRTKSVLLLGQILRPTEYDKALRRQAEWQRTLRKVLKKVDFIAVPTLQSLPLTVPLFGSSAVLEARVLALQNTSAVNFGGNPALAIPIPVEHASVPVTSLQLVGPWLSEAQLLNAGRLVEASNPRRKE
ncbi:MAG: amidase [Chthoniobacterales bacterium]|nr:amidase [Chthoniobacterales bacterium]